MKYSIHKFSSPLFVEPGDSFILTLDTKFYTKVGTLQGENRKEVHRETFTKKQVMTHYAVIRLGENVGYIIGDQTLYTELEKIGTKE